MAYFYYIKYIEQYQVQLVANIGSIFDSCSLLVMNVVLSLVFGRNKHLGVIMPIPQANHHMQ